MLLFNKVWGLDFSAIKISLPRILIEISGGMYMHTPPTTLIVEMIQNSDILPDFTLCYFYSKRMEVWFTV